MSYIGTLVEQEKQEEVTLQSVTMKTDNSTPHPSSGMWIPIYNCLY